MRNIILVCLIVCLFSACRPKDCFDSTSNLKSTRIVLDEFHTLEIGQNFDIELHQDTNLEPYLITEYSGGPYSTVTTEVREGVLKVRDEKTCDWSRNLTNRLKIYVNVHHLKQIDIHGSAQLSCRDSILSPDDDEFIVNYFSNTIGTLRFRGRRLTVNHRSLGEFRSEGRADIFVPVLYDAGKIDAEKMMSQFVFVYHYGINDCIVTPVVELESNVYNKGNVYYTDLPALPIRLKGNGSGKTLRK